jgi:uncharacterized membrane protein YeaQ/YmgE (transglycosylase-associated protein family)
LVVLNVPGVGLFEFLLDTVPVSVLAGVITGVVVAFLKRRRSSAFGYALLGALGATVSVVGLMLLTDSGIPGDTVLPTAVVKVIDKVTDLKSTGPVLLFAVMGALVLISLWRLISGAGGAPRQT